MKFICRKIGKYAFTLLNIQTSNGIIILTNTILNYNIKRCIESMKYDYENNKEYQKEYQKTSEKAKAARKRYYEKNKEYWGIKYQERYRTGEGKIIRMLQAAKTRAKKNNLEFNVTKDDITIPELCPIFGIPLIVNNKDYETGNGGYLTDNSPSLDRIDISKGYIKGNVQVISMKANMLKSNGSIEDFERIIQYIKDYSIIDA